MKALILKVSKFLENLLFPSICQGCGKVGAYLCDICSEQRISFVKKQRCHVCKKSVKYDTIHKGCNRETFIDGVFVLTKYSKFVEDYLGDIKYEFFFSMIQDLVRIMNEELEERKSFRNAVENSIITFVPLHGFRKRWRGFNQAEEMAKGIGKHWGVPVKKLLERKKRTKSQVGLKRKERLNNLDGAFGFRAATPAPEQIREGGQGALNQRNVIIVDDVMTSGATLEECAKVLKKNGVKHVYGLVFARG